MTTPAPNDDLVRRLRECATPAVHCNEYVSDLANEAATALETLAAENAALRSALSEAEDTLALAEHPSFPDPRHHDEVKRLGQRIGFGALMSTASAGWREVLADRPGGEFVAGPCHSTVVNTLRIIRATLTGAR